jgi:hypothetical protein
MFSIFLIHLCIILLLNISPSSCSSINSINISLLSSQSALQSGASIEISYIASVIDDFNITSLRLVPYWNGKQYGAEVGFFSYSNSTRQLTGKAFVPISWSFESSRQVIQLAYIPDWPSNGPTMGLFTPSNAILSNELLLDITLRNPKRQVLGSNPALMTVYFETWFTPLNFFWQSYAGGPNGAGMAEAIPSIGRYASVSIDAIRTQAAQFVQIGIDALVIDWTNNCWLPGCDSWDHRSLGIQELINATDLTFGVYAGLRKQGWTVPKFIILLGLDNGPTTPLPALFDELNYIANAYLNNETAGGASSFVMLDDKPLVLIFDGTGADHSSFSNTNFTIRWMASQLQNTPNFAKRGYWSWMDGILNPLLSVSPNNSSTVEAATLAPAFFSSGGWLNTKSAMGRSGGLTLFSELSSVLVSLKSVSISSSFFLNTCQWNEYAGTPEGPIGTSYEDSYSPDLSNDLEPTSPWASAYQRPGNVKSGGGYGYRGLNSLALVRALLSDPKAADGSTAIFILKPAVGDLSNYTSQKTIEIEWVITSFNSSTLLNGNSLLTNQSLPVSISIDGKVITTASAPSIPGPQSLTLDISAFDPRFPHVLTITALSSPNYPNAELTKWPLSFDTIDADNIVPLVTPIPATATAFLWVPETQI